MMHRLVRSSDVPAQPWRNGGGATRELLAWPSAADWQVRVSVADIESDGPFSSFPGVERWFTVLQGTGVELDIGSNNDSEIRRLHRGDAPLRFDGAAATHCRLLDSATRDLNLMLRDALGSMQIAIDGQDWAPDAAQCGLFSAVGGRCRIAAAEIALPPYALLWFDAAPASLCFIAEQRPAALIGWWLAATPRKASS